MWKLARDALDQVSNMRRLVVAIGIGRMSTSTDMVASAGRLILAEASEDCLRADHYHLRSLDDLTSRPDGALELVATHQLVATSAADWAWTKWNEAGSRLVANRPSF